jgi:hypothetical protein
MKALKRAAAQQWVAADRLTARKIGAILRFGIRTNTTVRGVDEGRTAAAEPWALGRLRARPSRNCSGKHPFDFLGFLKR